MYLVDRIIDKRKHKGKVQYKVKWEGYSLDEATWEPLEHLANVKDMVKDFLNNKRRGKAKECCEGNANTNVNTHAHAKDVKYLKVVSVNRDMKAKVEIEDDEGRRIKEMDTKVLREVCPVILIDFYETKLKFTDKK